MVIIICMTNTRNFNNLFPYLFSSLILCNKQCKKKYESVNNEQHVGWVMNLQWDMILDPQLAVFAQHPPRARQGRACDATHANTLIRALQHLFCECLLNRSKASQGFFSVIYWIVLKHFNRILSTRWGDFTTQAFGLWEEGGASPNGAM